MSEMCARARTDERVDVSSWYTLGQGKKILGSNGDVRGE